MGSLAEGLRASLLAIDTERAAVARPRILEASYKANHIGKPLAGRLAVQQGSMPTGKRAPGCRTYSGAQHGLLAMLQSGSVSVASLEWAELGRYSVAYHRTDNIVHGMAMSLYCDIPLIDNA